jgi:hypothetical protein
MTYALTGNGCDCQHADARQRLMIRREISPTQVRAVLGM